MDDQARAAYIMSQTACMMAEMNSMIAANQHCIAVGSPQIYYRGDFEKLPLRYGLDQNTVLEYLRAGR